MNKEQLKDYLLTLNIELDDSKYNTLVKYAKILKEYNQKTNLTAITDDKEIFIKHFVDSLTITKVIDLNKDIELLDIGSGAGFPGMVLKIFFPSIKLTIIDSNNKKTTFLNYLKEQLNLDNVTIIHDRAENYLKTNLNKFDIVTARAVANLRVISEISIPFVKQNGYFIAMKSSAEEEIKNAEHTINRLNSKIASIEEFNLFEYGKRTLIKIAKEKETNKKDLRPYSQIVKTELK